MPADHIYTSLDEALEKTPADFLLNVTPPAVHHEIAALAFTKGACPFSSSEYSLALKGYFTNAS